LWDNQLTPEVETRDEILLQALRDGLTYLRSSFRSNQMDDWLWGLIHQVRYQHFLGQAGVGIFDLGPFAAPGFRSTVNPAGFSLNANNLGFSSGPSMRFVVELDPAGIRAVNALPGGNHGDPGGDANDNRYNQINPEIHYGDHVAGWINGETFTYRFRPNEVAAHARRKVRYVGE
jgi:penicillin amidase